MKRILRNSDFEFIFEFEDIPRDQIPIPKEGDTFKYFGKTYHIDYVTEGFNDNYTSFLVIASPE